MDRKREQMRNVNVSAYFMIVAVLTMITGTLSTTLVYSSTDEAGGEGEDQGSQDTPDEPESEPEPEYEPPPEPEPEFEPEPQPEEEEPYYPEEPYYEEPVPLPEEPYYEEPVPPIEEPLPVDPCVEDPSLPECLPPPPEEEPLPVLPEPEPEPEPDPPVEEPEPELEPEPDAAAPSLEERSPSPEPETEPIPEPEPEPEPELPLCDGSAQDCVTENGDICLEGQGRHECECAEDMSNCPNHPSLQEPLPPPPEPGNPDFEPDEECLYDTQLPQCVPGEGQQCPEGFGTNEDGNCFPDHDQCPDDYHSHEDDETGECIPDDVPCDPGYIINPGYPSCDRKESVCIEYPGIDACKEDDDDDDDDDSENNSNSNGGGGSGGSGGSSSSTATAIAISTSTVITNINNHEIINKIVKHDRNSFPDIEIIGLSLKINGDSMICLMDISSSKVQCQQFGIPNNRIDADTGRIIELDTGKEYDNGNTGSSYIDATIRAVNDQNFNELKTKDNHDFKVDLAALGINDNGNGLVCLIQDDSGKGKALCEPFKLPEGEVTGQITEIISFDFYDSDSNNNSGGGGSSDSDSSSYGGSSSSSSGSSSSSSSSAPSSSPPSSPPGGITPTPTPTPTPTAITPSSGKV
jgi:hypothetical protein